MALAVVAIDQSMMYSYYKLGGGGGGGKPPFTKEKYMTDPVFHHCYMNGHIF